MRDDGADVETVGEQEGDDEGGVRRLFRIGPIGALAAGKREILHLYALQRLAVRGPTVNLAR